MVTNNTVSGATLAGISAENENTRVVGNSLSGNQMGISGNGLAVIDGNSIEGGGAGLVIATGSPVVSDNTVEGVDGRGLVVLGTATPTLTGNTSCDNGENLFLADGVDIVIDDSNTVCEDAPSS